MAQEFFITKKKTGRPPGKTRPPTKPVQVPVETLAHVDTWIAVQPEPKPSRPEAIRRLVEKGLDREGVDQREHQPQTDASLDRQIVEQKAAIAEMPEHSEPSPEAGMAAMDKAVAQNDLIDMKNKRTRRKNAKRK